MENVKYITFVGRSEWGVVNSFFSVLYHTDVRPEKVCVLYRASDEERAEASIAGLEEVLEFMDMDSEIEEHEIEDEFDLMKPAGELEDIMRGDGSVVIDITPARKFMASSALVEGVEKDVDAIYYLYIDSVEDADRPYLDIPLPRHDLVEMTGGEHLVG